jgi:hypothetical protein
MTDDKSKVRYDDFISAVQPDPAKPESTIMLSGFVGHGPDGHARVYPDPTLGTWYDVPEDDILHSLPIADSKLGGSHIWVRASAQITPGSAAPAATAPAQPQAAAAGIQPTPATHCFVCDPPMAAAGAAPGMVPTVWCTWVGCPQHGAVGAAPPSLWCSIVGCNPPTNGCAAGPAPAMAAAAPAAGGLPQTSFLCTQGLATFCGCTPGIDCAAPPPGGLQTQAPICAQGFPTFSCQTLNFACHTVACGFMPAGNGVLTPFGRMAAPAQMTAAFCTMVPACQPTPATICFVCPPITKDCTHQPACPPPTHAINCPSQPVVCNTMPTPQTHCFICPPPQTHQLHCPTQPVVCNIQPTPSVVHHCGAPAGVAPTPVTMAMCQPTWIGCPQAAAMMPGGVDTLAACRTVVCTTMDMGCPTRICAANGVFTPFGR